MDESTRLTFYLENLRSQETLCQETRTLKGWTGLTDAAMEGWSVLQLDGVLEQARENWVHTQVFGGWKIEKET